MKAFRFFITVGLAVITFASAHAQRPSTTSGQNSGVPPESAWSSGNERRSRVAPALASASTGSYASNLVVIREAQAQALEQAREFVQQVQGERERTVLQSAIKEMERSLAALEEAETSPEKLPGALAAQQNAYQALLKGMPREYRMTRQQRNQQQQGGAQSGEPQRQQMEQLEMAPEENRYETERQARAEPTAQQREQSQTADRLRDLAHRQQDINERLRELQTALQAARTEAEREELRRELKRLRDEQRQMLADVDQLRQQMEQSSNANPESREQLEQTRNDMQRAAEEMANESPSGALAAGNRAQQSMQELRDDIRREASSQFSEQMRELRNQARELSRREEEIARNLDQLENGREQSLDTRRERRDIAEQIERQQSGLTNLLAQMRSVTEASESTEPLLSRQLYDTLRRADQEPTENLMRVASQLTDAGFLPQAMEAERVVRGNIDSIRDSIERAAESVLGDEAETLRFAQNELEELTRQIEREMSARDGDTNSVARGNAAVRGGETNSVAAAGQRRNGQSGREPDDEPRDSQAAAAGGQQGSDPQGQQAQRGESSQQGQGGRQAQQGQRRQQGGSQGNGESQEGQEPGQSSQQTAQAGGRPQGQPSGQGEGTQQAAGESGQRNGRGAGEARSGEGQQPSEGSQESQQASNSQQSGQRGAGGQQRANGGPREGSAGGQRFAGGGSNTGGGGGDIGDLRQLVENFGRDQGDYRGGPITGGDYVNWADRLRDVERVLDQDDLRNELANVRERVSQLRGEFRESGRKPSENILKQDVVAPLTQVRVWLRQELARRENPQGLAPLDRDPVPENFAELVRKYYEQLGNTR